MVSLDNGTVLTFSAALFPQCTVAQVLLTSRRCYVAFSAWQLQDLQQTKPLCFCLVVCRPIEKTLQSLLGVLTDKDSAYAEK